MIDRTRNWHPVGEPSELYLRTKALFQEQRYEEIVALCEAAEARGDYDADIAAVHSVTLLKLKRMNEAIAFLEIMLYYFPTDARLHTNLGAAYGIVGRRSEMNAEYAMVRSLDPEGLGGKLKRQQVIRYSIFAISLVVFLLSFMFWPHTRWVIVGLCCALIGLNLYLIVYLLRIKETRRVLPFCGILALWILILVLALLRS